MEAPFFGNFDSVLSLWTVITGDGSEVPGKSDLANLFGVGHYYYYYFF